MRKLSEDKVAVSGLPPAAVGDGVTFKEANYTFVCRKLYQHQIAKANLARDMQEIILQTHRPIHGMRRRNGSPIGYLWAKL